MDRNDIFVFKASQIRSAHGLKAELKADIKEFADAFSSPEVLAALNVLVDFEEAGGDLILNCGIGTRLNLVCARCAEPLTKEYKTSFGEVYGAGTEIINIREAVRDSAALTEPMKVLCKDDCKGRCPVCGTNLNINKCDCVQGSVHSFEALKGWKQKK